MTRLLQPVDVDVRFRMSPLVLEGIGESGTEHVRRETHIDKWTFGWR